MADTQLVKRNHLVVRTSLRERQKAAVREELRAVAIDAFLDRGYDQANIADIAMAAGVSERTFYRHFPTKELVALDWIDNTAGTVHEVLRQQPIGVPPSRALFEAFVAVAPPQAASSPHRRIMPIVFRTPHLLNAYLEHTRTWAAAVAEVLAERLGTTVASDPRPRMWSMIAFAIANEVAQSTVVLAGSVDYATALRSGFEHAADFFHGALE